MFGDGLRFTTENLVSLFAALIGGAFALLGGWLGARWAARYQGRQAASIAQGIRQQERDESTKERLEAMRDELQSLYWDLEHDRLTGRRLRIFRDHLLGLLTSTDPYFPTGLLGPRPFTIVS